MAERWHLIDKCPHCGKTLRQRSTEQNAAFHALLQNISTQRQWAGQWLDLEDWKRLMVAAWCRAEKEHVRMFPAIDGSGFDVIYRRTSRLSKQEMAELLEFATAWAIENGIKLSETTQHCEHEWTVKSNAEPGRCMKCGIEA